MEQQSEKIDLNDLFIPISVLQNLIKETDISKKIIEEEHSELFFETLSGTGKIQLENNISYSGNMRFGIFDGGINNVPCTLDFSDGTKYEGDIHNNQITGHGKYTFVTGATYEGEVLNGLRHGYGEFTAADGTKYLGNWANGLKNGMGNQINANMTYEGEWKDGIIDGNGKMKWISGCIYEGEL